jgi:hypothetical protein
LDNILPAGWIESANPFSWNVEDYLSPHLPTGFNTVIGHMASTNPEALMLMGEPVKSLYEDQRELDAICAARFIPTGLTIAPRALAANMPSLGVYPVSLLAAFVGV